MVRSGLNFTRCGTNCFVLGRRCDRYSARQVPIIGKNAIRNYVTASLKIPGFSIQWKTTQFTIARDCDLAYGVGTNQVSFNDENGNRVTLRGKAVAIWRMENDAWKCVVDIWNDDPAPK